MIEQYNFITFKDLKQLSFTTNYNPRYMYKNAMSMEDTVFTMNVNDDGNMSGSASASLDSTNPIMER